MLDCVSWMARTVWEDNVYNGVEGEKGKVVTYKAKEYVGGVFK